MNTVIGKKILEFADNISGLLMTPEKQQLMVAMAHIGATEGEVLEGYCVACVTITADRFDLLLEQFGIIKRGDTHRTRDRNAAIQRLKELQLAKIQLIYDEETGTAINGSPFTVEILTEGQALKIKVIFGTFMSMWIGEAQEESSISHPHRIN